MNVTAAMLEELSAVEEGVAKARKSFRAQVESLCLPEEEQAVVDEVTPIPGLREQSLGVIPSRG